jgi:DNA-binding transcriptional MocR family regulator
MTERSTRYERIAQTLGTLIERGVLRPGDRLPSLRGTREQSGASFGTTKPAYARLEDSGLIEARPRSGYCVRARPSRPAAEPAVSALPTVSTEVTSQASRSTCWRQSSIPKLCLWDQHSQVQNRLPMRN